MIDAKFLRDHFTIVHVTDKPAPRVDPEALEWILSAMDSATARLRGQRCDLADSMAATTLAIATSELRELMGVDK